MRERDESHHHHDQLVTLTLQSTKVNAATARSGNSGRTIFSISALIMANSGNNCTLCHTVHSIMESNTITAMLNHLIQRRELKFVYLYVGVELRAPSIPYLS